MFLNIQIGLIILKTHDQQFTLTTKKSLHTIFNKFFPIVDTCLSCEDIARESCAMDQDGKFLAIFLCPVFSASLMQHVSDLHPKFALRPHHV